MKIFIDTANVDEIREAMSLGLLDGVTTNPTLIASTGRDTRAVLKEICDIVPGPVSGEVLATTYDEMLREAQTLASIAPNIVVKIPLILEGLKVVKKLTQLNIKTNVTLCFSPLQAMLAAKAGATYISPFVGRLDDVGHEGMDVVEQTLGIFSNYGFTTEVLVASIRSPLHVLTALRMGADVATIPFKVLKQLIKHPLTDVGLAQFLQDGARIPKS